MAKYIFVIGGVMSGVGKGITTASLGKILQARGYGVTALKIDPYINVDAGTMNPAEHGEVFVTVDGDETDQDIGNYERFLNQDITRVNYMTTGRVYQEVITRERNLVYGGKCVEVVPHVPEEIIRRINLAVRKTKADIAIIEIGGTVGEYQNILFLEAARMLHFRAPKDVLFVVVSYLPIPAIIGEMKTKPTQYASRTLNSAGIQPDFIICRSSQSLDKPRKDKLAVFCNVTKDAVISVPDAPSIYEVPLILEKEHLSKKVLERLDLKVHKRNLVQWESMVRRLKKVSQEVRIGIVGKYFHTGDFVLADAYISVIEAVKHAAAHLGKKPVIDWLDAALYEQEDAYLADLAKYDGVIVPGGFGSRGVEGKIKAIRYLRERQIPYLGICYGMQLAVIEFARNVCKLDGASSTEINPETEHPVIHIMDDQVEKMKQKSYGATMRLGNYEAVLTKGSKARLCYGKSHIVERHRHRYELNNAYRDIIERNGMRISGISPDKRLVEVVELLDHPYFMGTQFHPEFTSRPLYPNPLFVGFLKAGGKKRDA